MRGLTVGAVIAVVLIGAVLYLRSGEPPERRPSVPAPVARPPAPGPGERSARVEERLSELREDYEHRQAAPGNVAPSKREVPTMSARQREMMKQDQATDDDEDPEEMDELKVTLLTDPDPDERIGAVLMLTGEEGPQSLRMLLEAMDDPDPEVRLAVVEALGDRSEEISPATLVPALRDPDAEVRFEAVSILGDMESPEALAMVRSARADEDEDVRALAEGIEDFADEHDDDEDEPDAQTAQVTPQPPHGNRFR